MLILQPLNCLEILLFQLNNKWYGDSVPDRSGIAIQSGNYERDTAGCFLPGDNYSYDTTTGTYNVWNSKKKTKELFDFFENYGRNGIKINVSSELTDFIK